MPQTAPAQQRSQAIQPGIDVQWPTSEVISFNQLTYEGRLSGPRRDVSHIRDASITLRLKCTGIPPLYPDDVHIYIASGTLMLDVTNALIGELRQLLDEGSPVIREEEYKRGVESWLSLVRDRSEIVGYSQEQVDNEMRRASVLASTHPLSQLLNRLGDRTVGYGGSLHVSNFLYDSISLPPLLLSKIIARYNADQPKPVSLTELYPLDLVVSYGVLRGTLRGADERWQRVSNISGALHLTSTWFFSNELVPEFDDLEHKIKTRIVEINTKLGASGDIQQALASLSDDLKKITEAASSLNTISSDTQKQLASVQATLDALATRLVNRL